MLTGVVAHQGQPLAPHDVWTAWGGDPLLTGLLMMTAALYAVATRGRSRRTWARRATLAGLAAVAVALVSPLDTMAGALASAHMVQHLVLTLVAAPLLAMGAPHLDLLRYAPPNLRRRAHAAGRRVAGSPGRRRFKVAVVASLVHAGTLWLWHSAVLYDAALRVEVVHAAAHLTLLVTAVLFWSVVLRGWRRRAEAALQSVLLLFTMALQGVLLAALLAFSTRPWYTAYLTTTRAWGLEPLADQQLAGALMAVPGGFVYLAAALALLLSVVNDEREPGDAVGRERVGARA